MLDGEKADFASCGALGAKDCPFDLCGLDDLCVLDSSDILLAREEVDVRLLVPGSYCNATIVQDRI